ncbi:MAG: hypothetical protein ACYDBV_11775 [Nitrospiria bacterium]
MPKLFAHFEIEMPGQCLIALPENEKLLYSSINGFDVDIHLITDSMIQSKREGEAYFTRGLNRALVVVSRNESVFPPPVIPNERGEFDFSIQKNYFNQMTPNYSAAGREAINRIIRFFRYVLKTPLLREFEPNHQGFQNAKWKNEMDEEIGKAPRVIVLERIPGWFGELGSKKLTLEEVKRLEDFVVSPFSPSIIEQLLSDAQSAWFEGNLHRTVLEMALACEIAVKRKFFPIDSQAGAAFDYLEDKSQVKVRIIDLIDQVAIEVFGKSFKNDHPKDYENIDYLFRCRNKVAHRAELLFRDALGKKIAVDEGMVEVWFNSVIVLKEWIDDLQNNP